MTKGGFFAAGISALAAMLVLVFAGFVIFMLFAAWALIAAIIAFIPVVYVESRREWSITQESPTFIIPLMVAFMISGAAAFAIDLIFKTYVSVPAMIDALDLTRWEAARRVPLIGSVLDYYRFVFGPTPVTWLRFAGQYLVIVLAFTAVLSRIPREPEIEPVPQMQWNLQLLVLSAVAVGTMAVTLFPLTTWAMIALRNATH